MIWSGFTFIKFKILISLRDFPLSLFLILILPINLNFFFETKTELNLTTHTPSNYPQKMQKSQNQ